MNTLKAILQEAEKRAIMYALLTNEGKIGATAKALGICRKTIWEKMKRHNIRYEDLSNGQQAT